VGGGGVRGGGALLLVRLGGEARAAPLATDDALVLLDLVHVPAEESLSTHHCVGAEHLASLLRPSLAESPREEAARLAGESGERRTLLRLCAHTESS